MEAKTITVSAQTHKGLEILKESSGAGSFNELLDNLIKEKIGIKKTMFGAAKGIKAAFARTHKDRV